MLCFEVREKAAVTGAHGRDVWGPLVKIERRRMDCKGWRRGIDGGGKKAVKGSLGGLVFLTNSECCVFFRNDGGFQSKGMKFLLPV